MPLSSLTRSSRLRQQQDQASAYSYAYEDSDENDENENRENIIKRAEPTMAFGRKTVLASSNTSSMASPTLFSRVTKLTAKKTEKPIAKRSATQKPAQKVIAQPYSFNSSAGIIGGDLSTTNTFPNTRSRKLNESAQATNAPLLFTPSPIATSFLSNGATNDNENGLSATELARRRLADRRQRAQSTKRKAAPPVPTTITPVGTAVQATAGGKWQY
jgi:hypothetical protein